MPVALQFRPITAGQFDRDAVVLGCAPSAGLYLKPTPLETVLGLLHEAARYGVPAVDTAPLYGCGRSELDVGRAFAAAPKLMDGKVTIATKVGRLCLEEKGPEVAKLQASDDDEWRVERDTKYYARDRDTGHLVCVADYTAAGFLKSLEQSRARLAAAGNPGAANAIHTVRIHDVESEEKFDMLTAGGGVDALVKLREQGAIKAVGLGMNRPEWILKLLDEFPKGTFDSVLMAGAWNLMDQSGRSVLAACERLGVEVHIAGVFGAGLLWGAQHYRYDHAGAEVVERRDQLAALCRKHGVELPWLAMHFATRPKVVTKLVFGCRDATEFRRAMAVLEAGPPKDRVAALYSDLAGKDLLPLSAFRTIKGQL